MSSPCVGLRKKDEILGDKLDMGFSESIYRRCCMTSSTVNNFTKMKMLRICTFSLPYRMC